RGERPVTRTILRGRVLTFVAEPQGASDTDSYRYWADGAVSIEDGLVIAVGDFSPDLAGEVIDHRPHLILPGFIDTHLHYVQAQVIGAYAASLLDWLNDYTFIVGQKFARQGHGRAIAEKFFDVLIRQGTTTCV